MSRHVKGVLFAEYVRMMRRHTSVDWKALLPPEDHLWLRMRVDTEEWYPMDAFERLGNAILSTIGSASLDTVRQWGRASALELRTKNPMLVAEGDPVETFHRFRVMRSTFFDFEALSVPSLCDGHAEIVIDYGMGRTAEEAASVQALGFFEMLLEVAGARDIRSKVTQARWRGDAQTEVVLDWEG